MGGKGLTSVLVALAVIGVSPIPSQSSRLPAAPAEPLQVANYDISIDVPDSGTTIGARAELTVVRQAPADTLRLDFVGLRVDSVLVNDRQARFRRDSSHLFVALPGGSQDTLHVSVTYGGSPTDGLIIHTAGEGRRWTAFGDNWPTRARYWIPSIDTPADKATVSWTVTAPVDRTVVANGQLLERSVVNGPGARARWVWREHNPVPTYVMVIAVAKLDSVDLGRTACGLGERAGCVQQTVYLAPEAMDWAPGPFARAGEMVSFFGRLIAPFPYERLVHVQSSTRFGGMENATAIFYSDEAVRSRTLREETVAHETAHQWFGDAVTPQRFADVWLSEGFATYWADLWVRHASGDSAFRDAMDQQRRQILGSTTSAARPVIDTTETDFLRLLNTNSYQKGAWALHMLRVQLGDSVFVRGVRAYYAAHRHGTARTDDLEHALEGAAGDSLRWFFDQWLRRPGWPEVSLKWRYDGASRRVTLSVEQSRRFAPYRFPLTVALRDGDGRAHKVTVQVAAVPTQSFVLPMALSESPRSLDPDPDVELLASFHAS